MNAAPKAAPAPRLGRSYQIGPQCVSLHIAYDLIEILVGLDGEGLVATLVNMAEAHLSSVFLPAPNMRNCEALHEGRQIAVVLWPQNEVPMLCEA